MTTRKLAQFEVSSVGIGCMGFSHGYGALPPEEESIRLMRKAFDMGCTLFDTAEVYGPFVNETLVGKAVKPFRDKIVLTTKFTPCRVGDQDISDAEKLTAKGCTKAQLALAWMLAKWPHVVPIPGMRSDARIEENLGAADVSLSPDELAEVEEALSHIVIHGNRTDEDIQRMGYVKPQ